MFSISITRVVFTGSWVEHPPCGPHLSFIYYSLHIFMFSQIPLYSFPMVRYHFGKSKIVLSIFLTTLVYYSRKLDVGKVSALQSS